MSSIDDAELYLEEYYKHRNAGDDPMNAELRIVEQGCPSELARQIREAAGEGDEKWND